MNSTLFVRTRALNLLGLVHLAFAYAAYGAHWVIPVCVFRLLTGFECPLCGLTRSIGAALHGQFVTALQFHVLGPAVVIANCWAALGLILNRGPALPEMIATQE